MCKKVSMEVEELTVEEIAKELVKYKFATRATIDTIMDRLQEKAARLDGMEAHISEFKSLLKKHELQRTSFNEEVKIQLSEVKLGQVELKEGQKKLNSWFGQHGVDEMDKYNEILDAIRDLTQALEKTAKETDENTIAISKAKHDEEVARAVQDAVEAQKEPYREYKKKIINVALAIVTAGVLAGVWKLTVFIINLNEVINGTPN